MYKFSIQLGLLCLWLPALLWGAVPGHGAVVCYGADGHVGVHTTRTTCCGPELEAAGHLTDAADAAGLAGPETCVDVPLAQEAHHRADALPPRPTGGKQFLFGPSLAIPLAALLRLPLDGYPDRPLRGDRQANLFLLETVVMRL